MRAVVGFRTVGIESEVVWVTETRRGFSVGVFHPIGDVHSTWHRDGTFHVKGMGRTHARHKRAELESFTGWQQAANQGIPFLIRPGVISGRPVSTDPRIIKRMWVDRQTLQPKDAMMLNAFLMSGEGEQALKKWLQTPQEGSEIIDGHVLDLDHFPKLKLVVALYRFLR